MSQSIKSDRITESTVARIAGNIAGHLLRSYDNDTIARMSVRLARMIAAEVERTKPGQVEASDK